MKRTLNINAGSALLLDESSEVLAGYDAIQINAGSALVSKKVHEKLSTLGLSLNCGQMTVIDVQGRLTELPGGTVLNTASASRAGCFLICEGNLIVEDAQSLAGITGLYAEALFYPASADLSGVGGITASRRVAYPDGAQLRFEELNLDENAPIALESGSLYWVDGCVTALDGAALETLRKQQITFDCRQLAIRTGLYEQFKSLFKAERFVFIPDDHAVVREDITLDAATALLYGDKLLVRGDLMIPYDQPSALSDFASLIIHGTVTMPVAAAAAFKAVGKADAFDLYEGRLMSVNGFEMLTHDQLQSAVTRGVRITIKVNGSLIFAEDVGPDDMEAIAALHCNGVISVPGAARGELDGKIRAMNGQIMDLGPILKKKCGEDFTLSTTPPNEIMRLMHQLKDDKDSEGSGINAGSFRL